MSQLDKIIERIRKRPPEADFDDVCKLLEAYGYRFDRERGSHCYFVKPGEQPFTVPKKHGHKVKRVYLVEICKRLGLDD